MWWCIWLWYGGFRCHVTWSLCTVLYYGCLLQCDVGVVHSVVLRVSDAMRCGCCALCCITGVCCNVMWVLCTVLHYGCLLQCDVDVMHCVVLRVSAAMWCGCCALCCITGVCCNVMWVLCTLLWRWCWQSQTVACCPFPTRSDFGLRRIATLVILWISLTPLLPPSSPPPLPSPKRNQIPVLIFSVDPVEICYDFGTGKSLQVILWPRYKSCCVIGVQERQPQEGVVQDCDFWQTCKHLPA